MSWILDRLDDLGVPDYGISETIGETWDQGMGTVKPYIPDIPSIFGGNSGGFIDIDPTLNVDFHPETEVMLPGSGDVQFGGLGYAVVGGVILVVLAGLGVIIYKVTKG